MSQKIINGATISFSVHLIVRPFLPVLTIIPRAQISVLRILYIIVSESKFLLWSLMLKLLIIYHFFIIPTH